MTEDNANKQQERCTERERERAHVAHLLKAWADAEGDVDEDGVDAVLLHFGKDLAQSAHGLKRDFVIGVVAVVHSVHHGGQHCRRVLAQLVWRQRCHVAETADTELAHNCARVHQQCMHAWQTEMEM